MVSNEGTLGALPGSTLEAQGPCSKWGFSDEKAPRYLYFCRGNVDEIAGGQVWQGLPFCALPRAITWGETLPGHTPICTDNNVSAPFPAPDSSRPFTQT